MDTISDADIRQIWRDSGGGFYGPHVEHADMEEAKFLPFMRKLLDENRRYRGFLRGIATGLEFAGGCAPVVREAADHVLAGLPVPEQTFKP